jgi:hypothetical protein
MRVCERAAAAGAAGVDAVVDELAAALGAPALVIVFASSALPVAPLAAALTARFSGARVMGCTTEGELGPDGVCVESAVALALYAPAVRAGVGPARELRGRMLTASRAAVITAARELGRSPLELDPRRHVAVTLFDPRGAAPEGFCLATAATAPQIQFVGGGASHLPGAAPRVFLDGELVDGGGVIAVLETELPFAVVGWEHMVPTPARAVVTRADHERRVVHELDGVPALARYRALVAAHGGEITDSASAAVFPFARYVEGKPYVRSVRELRGDDLVMACAVEAGQILRLMRTGDLVGTTDRELAAADAQVGGMCALLAFSCMARDHEARRFGLGTGLGAVYKRYPVVGFHSFGEQLGATLVNHTLTGLAIGAGPPEPTEGGDG